MNILQVENSRRELTDKLRSNCSKKQKAILIFHFLEFLLGMNDRQIIEAYLLDLIGDYTANLEEYSPLYIRPKITIKIINQIEILLKFDFLSEYSDKLNTVAENLQKGLEILFSILDGQPKKNDKKNLYIPLLELNKESPEPVIGFLETLTVKINNAETKNNFIVIPSVGEKDETHLEQINTSWEVAVSYVKKYVKNVSDFHDVIIWFDNDYGILIGDSLGTALTLCFIEALLKFYGSSILIKVSDNIAVTGGMDYKNRVLTTSKDIIEKKLECVFYSGISIFAVPEKEKIFAEERLKELQSEYPNKKIEIVGISNLQDLLNRRNLVEIKKQNLLSRTAKISANHGLSIILILILIVTFAFLFLKSIDDNPYHLDNIDHNVLVKNKEGKVLWSKKMSYSISVDNPDMSSLPNSTEKLIDVDGDGVNEVILCYEDPKQIKEPGSITCYKNNSKVLWRYSFHDSISTRTESFNPTYIIFLAGVENRNNRKELILFCYHSLFYPSAVFKLDALTGKRIGGTFWNSGRILAGAYLHTKNGRSELLLTGMNNGYNRSVFFAIDPDSLYGRSPSTYDYIFTNKKLYNFYTYIILPVTDYCSNYFKQRYNYPRDGCLTYDPYSKKYQFQIEEGPINDGAILAYRISSKLNDLEVAIPDEFRVKRDSLVARGILSPPLSDTPEYIESLMKQVRYWNGTKLVTKAEYLANKPH